MPVCNGRALRKAKYPALCETGEELWDRLTGTRNGAAYVGLRTGIVTAKDGAF